jgi:hypothetical protein
MRAKIKCSKCHKFLGIYEGEEFILTYYGDRSKGAWITCASCYEKCQSHHLEMPKVR